ncbi:hypothetical protein HYH02_012998 [Chlamydomonas schloesseri]|uniref:Uncharacterized protein n=1 Tax=Chlamydomonas schloesseri TaxID=2026947 RepID=A0A835SSA7_9CHLO|nr:hypothetical protein HYH02_012998 [Chlamydomonas schloesseri]|eukprot:KAG2432427.1 hypothetical protein HYH02_012998 [Chlamydomonas schloesseri]
MRASHLLSRCPASGQPVVDLVRRRRPQFSARAQATQAADGPASRTSSQQQHLQRSLEQGPANKLVVDFDYVAVAFKTEPRRASKRRQSQSRRRSLSVSSDDEGGVGDKLFGGGPGSSAHAGYWSLEYVSGDRRVLFEDRAPSAGPGPATSDISSSYVSSSSLAGSPAPSPAVAAVPPVRACARTLGSASGPVVQASRPAPPRRLGSARARAEATSARVGAAAAPAPRTQHAAAVAAVAASLPAHTPPLAVAAASARNEAAQEPHAVGLLLTRMTLPNGIDNDSISRGGVLVVPGADAVVRLPLSASPPAWSPCGSEPPPPQQQQQQPLAHGRQRQPRPGGSRGGEGRPASDGANNTSSNNGGNGSSRSRSDGGGDSSLVGRSVKGSGSGKGASSFREISGGVDDSAYTGLLPHTAEDGAMEAAAVQLLRMPLRAVRANRVFHAELTGLGFGARGRGPQQLRELLDVLGGGGGGGLGLAHEQVLHVLLAQPRVMRVKPATLRANVAALAAALQLQPGAEPLSAAVAAAPDALLQRSPAAYGQCVAALAAALALPRAADACALMLRAPSLLRHPPAFYARSVQQLQSQLALAPDAARALAAAEPGLMCVSPAVLRVNGEELRERLQLSPAQVGAVAAYAPELLAAPPGRLAAAARRLVAALSYSGTWRSQLSRLLASPRNTAVALSFRSDRYERLEYLTRTGRDGAMGFKEALSLEDADFLEVFPGYSQWRREQGR